MFSKRFFHRLLPGKRSGSFPVGDRAATGSGIFFSDFQLSGPPSSPLVFSNGQKLGLRSEAKAWSEDRTWPHISRGAEYKFTLAGSVPLALSETTTH